jgi:hypothetical protein
MPPPTNPILKVLILSDVHAIAENGKPERSFCRVGPDYAGATRNPLDGIEHLCRTGEVSADLILCAGDLGDQAVPNATEFAWRKVHAIAEALGNCVVLATAGNHDVDSRHVHNHYDARGVLQKLTPRFPISDETLFDRYWSRHFVVFERDNYRVLLLNSSAYHGTADRSDRGGGSSPEHEHGRVADSTLDAIETELARRSPLPINILLCHHHPHQHSEHGLGEIDLMKGGQKLIDLLSQSACGQWLIVHGHKHHPKITYAAGSTSSSPVVFAAGSVSAVLYHELTAFTRNQFHIVELDPNEISRLGLVGKFETWDWASGKGWKRADELGLPPYGGFGVRQNVNGLAELVSRRIRGNSMMWKDVCDEFSEIHYLLPMDVKRLIDLLQSNYNALLLYDDKKRIMKVEMLA